VFWLEEVMKHFNLVATAKYGASGLSSGDELKLDIALQKGWLTEIIDIVERNKETINLQSIRGHSGKTILNTIACRESMRCFTTSDVSNTSMLKYFMHVHKLIPDENFVRHSIIDGRYGGDELSELFEILRDSCQGDEEAYLSVLAPKGRIFEYFHNNDQEWAYNKALGERPKPIVSQYGVAHLEHLE
jgi:hypothetical protein